MSKISVLFQITAIAIIIVSCKPEEMVMNLPGVTTAVISNSTDTSAICGGEVIENGASVVSERGVCWGLSPLPVISGNHTVDGTGLGVFTSYISGLSSGTTYYVRAYATNTVGTAYGEDRSFIALTLPTVTTADITNVSVISATCGGNVTNEGATGVIDKGVCWSTSHAPTILNSSSGGGNGPGSFTCNITNILEDSIYYVRAYATNSNGTSYGEEKSFMPVFTCGQDFRDNRDAYVYATVLIGQQCWMKQNLNYGTYVNTSLGQSAAGTQKFCQKNISTNCETAGGMYVWTEVMNGDSACNGIDANQPECSTPVRGICPVGWHIPSHYEWTVLEKNVGSSPGSFLFDETTTGWLGIDEGQNIKMDGAAYWSGTGTNTSGFSAVGGGYFLGVFAHFGERGKWWTSTESSSTMAWDRALINTNSQVAREIKSKDYAFSLRCIKDN